MLWLLGTVLLICGCILIAAGGWIEGRSGARHGELTSSLMIVGGFLVVGTGAWCWALA